MRQDSWHKGTFSRNGGGGGGGRARAPCALLGAVPADSHRAPLAGAGSRRVIVDTGQLLDANGKLTASQSASEISGKGIGGLLVQALTAPVAVLIDAISFLVSAISLRRIRIDEPRATPAADRPRLRRQAAEGLGVVLGNRYVRPLLGEATTFNFFNEIFMIGLLLYTVRDLDLGPAQIGLILTTGGVGTFTGAWYGARVADRFGYGRALLVTMLLGNTAPAAVVFVDGPGAAVMPAFGAVFFLMGSAPG